VEQFENNDDNDNDSDYVEDVSVHGSWVTRRYPQRQAICSVFLHARRFLRVILQIEIKESKTPGDEHYLDPPGAELLAWSKN
jgi:hypothetical protein